VPDASPRGHARTYRRKLIEVELPFEPINVALARAVILLRILGDPSKHAERSRAEAAQEKERQRLLRLIVEAR
jgi:hypothetical protein